MNATLLSAMYQCSHKLWESLSAELDFNIMFSQRGTLQLAHSEGQLSHPLRQIFAPRHAHHAFSTLMLTNISDGLVCLRVEAVTTRE